MRIPSATLAGAGACAAGAGADPLGGCTGDDVPVDAACDGNEVDEGG